MSSIILELVTGDDVGVQIQLTKDEVNFNIDSNATIKAAVVSKDRKNTLIDPVTVNRVVIDPVSGDPLSDWVNSLLYIEFDSTETNSITSSYFNKGALIEIQVDDPVNSTGKQTWFQKIKILQGTIDQ